MLRTPIVLFLLVLFILPTVNGQPADTLLTDKRKVRQFAAVTGAGYGIGVVAMYQLWYKDIPRQSFRFFNDNAEWKQIDKAGHFFSAFYISKGTAHVLRDCGIPSRRSAVIGSLTGFALLLPVEIFDGYSEAYGASTGDLIANAAGSSFFLSSRRYGMISGYIRNFPFIPRDTPPIAPKCWATTPCEKSSRIITAKRTGSRSMPTSLCRFPNGSILR